MDLAVFSAFQCNKYLTKYNKIIWALKNDTSIELTFRRFRKIGKHDYELIVTVCLSLTLE
jgi:hypothetical protein